MSEIANLKEQIVGKELPKGIETTKREQSERTTVDRRDPRGSQPLGRGRWTVR